MLDEAPPAPDAQGPEDDPEGGPVLDTCLQFTVTSLLSLLVLLGAWLLVSDVYLFLIGVDRYQP